MSDAWTPDDSGRFEATIAWSQTMSRVVAFEVLLFAVLTMVQLGNQTFDKSMTGLMMAAIAGSAGLMFGGILLVRSVATRGRPSLPTSLTIVAVFGLPVAVVAALSLL